MDIGPLGPLIKWSVPYLNLVAYAALSSRVSEIRNLGNDGGRIYDRRSFGCLNRYLDFLVAGVGEISNGAGGHGLYRGSPLASNDARN